MARRNDHSRKDIKEMAINAGIAYIEKYGHLDLSTRKVAKDIGYSVGTLYNVFENLEDLILHINMVIMKDVYFYVESSIGGLVGVDAIKQIASRYIDYSVEHTNKWSVLFEYHRPPDSEMPDWYKEKRDMLLQIPGKYLIEMFKGDREKALNVTRILWSSVHGICSLGRTHRLGGENPDILKAMSNSLIENYLLGLTIKSNS